MNRTAARVQILRRFRDIAKEARLRWFEHVQRRDADYVRGKMLRMKPLRKKKKRK